MNKFCCVASKLYYLPLECLPFIESDFFDVKMVRQSGKSKA